MSRCFTFVFATFLLISFSTLGWPGRTLEGTALASETDRQPTPKVLLIGVDGGTWNIMHPMMLRGRLKTITRMFENGTHGNLLSIPGYNSPALWNTVVTGFLPDAHGITDFVVSLPDADSPVPINSTMRLTKAIWNVLSDYERTVGVVGFWATWPAEQVEGVIVSDRAAFTRFRVTKKFRVGGEMVPFDYSGDRLLTYPEEFLEDIRSLLRDPSELTLEEASQLYPDDVRLAEDLIETQWTGGFNSKAPAVAQVKFQYVTDKSYGQICEKILREKRPDFAAVYFDGTDVICHMYGSDLDKLYTSPESQGPRLRAILNYYDFVDGLIGRLLEAAGEEYTVVLVSDHGFTARLKKKKLPVSKRGEIKKDSEGRGMFAFPEHHMDGVILMSGPGIRKGHILLGATLLDVMPTLAVLSGVPISRELPGRPLLDAFTPEYLASYTPDETETYGERSVSPLGIKSPEDNEILERLRSLGYIE